MAVSKNVFALLSLWLLMWIIKAVEELIGFDLGHLGVYPRHLLGLFGVLFSPLLHADWWHLLSNTFPAPILLWLLVMIYPKKYHHVFFLLYFLTGFCVWALGRSAYHIGASGLVYALTSLLFFSGIFTKEKRIWAVSFIIISLYSTLLLGIFPQEERISWESHLLGTIVGLVVAFSYRHDLIKTPSTSDLSSSSPKTIQKSGYRPLENSYFKYVYKEVD